MATLLAALHSQQPHAGPLAVVCCDDGSDPPLESALAVPAGVRVIRHPVSRGPAAARNTAWRALEADWIWFLDDDVLPEAGALAAMRAAAETAPADVGIIEGPVRSQPASPASLANPLVPRLPDSDACHRLTASIAYRRAVLTAVGGFDEGFPGAACEDFDLAYRVEDAGFRHAFAPLAVVRHAVHPPLSAFAWWRLRRLRRAAVVRLYTRHPERFGPPWVERFRSLIRRPGQGMTPSVFARFFIVEAALEAAAARRAWRWPHLMGLSWALALAATAGTVIDGLTGTLRAVASTRTDPPV